MVSVQDEFVLSDPIIEFVQGGNDVVQQGVPLSARRHGRRTIPPAPAHVRKRQGDPISEYLSFRMDFPYRIASIHSPSLCRKRSCRGLFSSRDTTRPEASSFAAS